MDFNLNDEQKMLIETLRTMGSPVTYEIDGRQYISIMAGTDDNDPPGRLFTFRLGDN